jgi:hypothetical protein
LTGFRRRVFLGFVPKLTAEMIRGGLPEEVRHFFSIYVDQGVGDEYIEQIELFWVGVKRFMPAPRYWRQFECLFFSKRPFFHPSSTGVFGFHPPDRVIHAAFETMIFFDLAAMRRHPKDFQVATVIEELVHVILNVLDEKLTTKIVCSLYPKVKYKNGRYGVRPSQGVDIAPLSEKLRALGLKQRKQVPDVTDR